MRNYNKVLLLGLFLACLYLCNGQDSVFVYNLDKSKILLRAKEFPIRF